MHTLTAPPHIYSIPLFEGMTDAEKTSLLQKGRMCRIPKGKRLFVFGDSASFFYIVCDGAICLSRETPGGHEITSDVLIGGDTIGETEILQGNGMYYSNATAVKETTLLEFPSAWLKENACGNGVFALNMMSSLARRARMLALEIEHKSTMSAAQQVVCFLERLCVLHNFDPAGFTLPYSKTLIASRLGMELETFSRALAKVREHGVSIEGSTVSFLDIRKIDDFVCRDCSIAGHCAEHELIKERLLGKRTARRA